MRRKFKEAEPYDKDRSAFALGKFKSLYDIERQCKEEKLTEEEIKK